MLVQLVFYPLVISLTSNPKLPLLICAVIPGSTLGPRANQVRQTSALPVSYVHSPAGRHYSFIVKSLHLDWVHLNHIASQLSMSKMKLD